MEDSSSTHPPFTGGHVQKGKGISADPSTTVGGDKVGSRQKHQGETVTRRLKMGETWRVILAEVPDQLLQDLVLCSEPEPCLALLPHW